MFEWVDVYYCYIQNVWMNACKVMVGCVYVCLQCYCSVCVYMSCDEINQMPPKVLGMCVCVCVCVCVFVFACGYTLNHNLMPLSNHSEPNRNWKPRETQTDKNTSAEAKIIDRYGLCVHSPFLLLLLSFGWSGGCALWSQGVKSTKVECVYFEGGQQSQGLLPFQSTMTHLSPNLFLQIASTFHSLNCTSLFHLFSLSIYPLLFPAPLVSFSPDFLLSYHFLQLSFSSTFSSFLSPVQPSSNHSTPESQSRSRQQLKWKRDECFSAKTLGGPEWHFWKIKQLFSSKIAATHCMMHACPVSRKGDPDLKPGLIASPVMSIVSDI